MKMTHYQSNPLLRRVQQWLDDDFLGSQPNLELANWMPTVDICETSQAFIVKADLPGIAKEDVDISLDNGVLTIRGKRQHDKETKEQGKLIRYERASGEFCRSFTLPTSLAVEQVQAKMKQGVLTITIPKKKENLTRSILIEE